MSTRPHAPRRTRSGPVRKARGGRAASGDPRAVALDALTRIEIDGGYANLVLAHVLDNSALDARDRGMVTEMVYGTTRMRRACDWLIDRFLLNDLEPRVRVALRLGAYQIAYMRVPAHAAVSATVDVVPAKVRGLTNAVLRRVADNPVDESVGPEMGGWPDLATRLSYPTWIVDRLTAELGADETRTVLEAMNTPATVHERDDGYIQDLASQSVGALIGARPGDLVVDVCAAPGGKATTAASSGAHVIALDLHANRSGLIAHNAQRLGVDDQVSIAVADGRHLPIRTGSADVVLVDAPCSGLGSLRRRADARWRIEPGDITRLAVLQRALVAQAATLVRPGGSLIYSVCTLLAEETIDVDVSLASSRPDLDAQQLGAPWTPYGRGGRLLPSADGSDGMVCFRYRLPS